MKYEDNVEVIATVNNDAFEKADVIIKEMCQLTTTLLNYKYLATHGDLTKGNVGQDELNKIAKDISIVVSDIDIYAKQIGVTEEVNDKRQKRVEKMARKLERK